MGFRNVGALARCYERGQTHFCSLRKVPSQASTAGHWVDLSMAAGNPKPQYYASAPLARAVLDGFDGIFHGAAKAPATKHLVRLGLMTPTPALVGAYHLLDYVAFYPFVDGDSLDEQAMDNTIPLPRYTNGDGLMVMAVASAPTTGGGAFTFTYVNQAGLTRTSPVIACNVAATNIATLATSEQATAAGGQHFLPLTGGCRGVRQITSVTFSAPSGGLLAFVLVKPIASLAVREINTPAEREFLTQVPGTPTIEDGAYLGLIANCAGSVAAGSVAGYCDFAWSE